jgi:D-beta-D-heptose 7-phosphate kinase/D-beta-D-heptose 1-phosphate adenosyltransferase
VFTNGCFDIIHKGHIELLKYASSLGHELVVGLNSDKSVKKLKGATRPYNDEKTRYETLVSLPFVKKVVVFNEETPYNIIKQIKPDFIVKGGDYTVEEVVGNDLAEVRLFPTVKGYSSSYTIGRINEDTSNRT